MSNIIASSKMHSFDIVGSVKENNTLDKDYYMKLDFRGAVCRTQPLKNANILYLQTGGYTCGYDAYIKKYCSNVEVRDYHTDLSPIDSFTLETLKKYDLIIVDNNAWSIPNNAMDKSKELADLGLPFYLIGNDTTNTKYATDVVYVDGGKDNNNQAIVELDTIPFEYNVMDIDVGGDSRNAYNSLLKDTTPLVTCKGLNIVFAYISPVSNTAVIQDNSASLNEDFVIKSIEYLLNTKNTITYKESLIRDDGYLLQRGYTNLWDNLTTGGNLSNNFTVMNYFDGDAPLPEGVKEDDLFWKVTPNNGMNYYTISGTDATLFPTGTQYNISAWVYVDKNCDMLHRSVKLCGEGVTPCSLDYDFNKLGTWQYLTTTVTSVNTGYYFLLYANIGYNNDPGHDWNKGNAYFTNVKVVASRDEFEYVTPSESNIPQDINVKNLDLSGDMTIIYNYTQKINRSKYDYGTNQANFFNMKLVDNRGNGDGITFSDYYWQNAGTGNNNTWMGHDAYTTSSYPGWHNHIGDVASYKPHDSDIYVIYRKSGNIATFIQIINGVMYKAYDCDYSEFDLLKNINIQEIVLYSDIGGLAKQLILYKKALSDDEISKMFIKNKHMSITLDGNIVTDKFSEKLIYPEGSTYINLGEDCAKQKIRYLNVSECGYIGESNISGDIINLYPETQLLDSTESLVTVEYDQSENMYIAHFTQGDNGAYRGFQLNTNKNIRVSAGKTYILEFEVYSQMETSLWVDLNQNGVETPTSTNDNNTSASGTSFTIPADKWTKCSVTYTMGNNSASYIISDAIIVSGSITKNFILKLRKLRLSEFIREGAPNIKTGNYKLHFNLYEDLNFKWDQPWTICYFKKPIVNYNNNINSYIIDSIGCNNNTVGGYYLWFGKTDTADRLSLSGNQDTDLDMTKFYNKWHFVTLVHDKANKSVKYTAHFEDGTSITCAAYSYDISKPNAFVTPWGYDLFLGGWDNSATCTAEYKDLFITQQTLTDEQINKLYKTWITDYENNTISIGSIREGGI